MTKTTATALDMSTQAELTPRMFRIGWTGTQSNKFPPPSQEISTGIRLIDQQWGKKYFVIKTYNQWVGEPTIQFKAYPLKECESEILAFCRKMDIEIPNGVFEAEEV
jgi:hypothetical protein